MRHADVEDDDVRLQLHRLLDRLGAVGGLAHDLDVVARLQDPHEPLPHDRVVVGEQHPDWRQGAPPSASSRSGSSAWTTVPLPGDERIVNRPFMNSTRSFIARTPKLASSSLADRRASGSKPEPASSMRTRSCDGSRESVTAAALAPEWRATFVKAS